EKDMLDSFDEKNIIVDHFEEYNFSSIVEEMTPWERILRLFYSLFRKEQLLEFYLHCGIKHIEHKLTTNASWYDEEHKALDITFADTLFHLVRSLDVLSPLIKSMILNNPPPTNPPNKQIPEIIEVVFYSIYKSQSIQSYPFSEIKMMNLFQGVPPSQMLHKKDHCVRDYIDSITEHDWGYIDIKYSNLIGVARLIELPLMDFLRRFAFDVSIHSASKISWDLVTISAVDSYLEMLYKVVDSFSLSRDYVDIIKSLNTSNKSLFDPSFPLTSQQISLAWDELVIALEKFKADDTLYNLLCISKKHPLISKENHPVTFSLREKFCSTLKKRVYSTSDTVIKNIFLRKIEDLMALIVLQKHYTFIPFGVYSIDNHKRIEKISSENLMHAFVLTSIYVFVYDSVQPWLKSFLGFLMVNAEFSDPESITILETLYKKTTKFMLKFHSFSQEVATKSPVSKRMQQFLDANNSKLTDEQVRILKMFIDSMNSQAGVLVSQFEDLIGVLAPFLGSVSNELQQEHQNFIPNVLAIKKLMNRGEIVRISNFYIFCQNVERLIQLEEQLNMLKKSKED
ncbi:MAG: hypothetical protein ACRCTJ_02010, partial [Brevinema sp.]